MDMKQILDAIRGVETKFKDFGESAEAINQKQLELADRILHLEQKGGATGGAADTRGSKSNFGSSVVAEFNKNADLFAKTGKLRLEVKAASDVVTSAAGATVASGGVGSLNENVLGIQNGLPIRSVSGINSLIYSRYVSQEGAAGVQGGEGVKKAALRPTFTEITQSALTIAGFTKLSRQAATDSEELRRAIEITLRRSVGKSLDAALMSGNVTPAFDGFLGLAVAATGTYTNLVDCASEAVANMQENGFAPNAVVLRPSDFLAIQVAKGSDGHYLTGSYLGPLTEEMRGVQVVLSPSVPAGKVMVADTAHMELLLSDTMSIELGYENDDFTKNIVTVLGEMRAIPSFRVAGAARLITPTP